MYRPRLANTNRVMLSLIAAILLCIQLSYSSPPAYLQLEKARYEFDIEGNPKQAKETLLQFLKNFHEGNDYGEALYLLGRIFENEKKSDSAVTMYQKALEKEELPLSIREKIFIQLSKTAPNALTPVHSRPITINGFQKQKKHIDKRGVHQIFFSEHVIERDSQLSTSWLEIDHNDQITQGQLLHPQKSSILDRWNFYSLFYQDKALYYHTRISKKKISGLRDTLSGAQILSTSPLHAITWNDNYLYQIRGEQVLKKWAIKDSSCKSYPLSTAGTVLLGCTNGTLYEFDLNAATLKTLNIRRVNPQIQIQGKYVGIQSSGQIEIFDSHQLDNPFAKLTMPQKNIDRWWVENNHLVVLEDQSTVKLYDIESGVLLWKIVRAIFDVQVTSAGICIIAPRGHIEMLDWKGVSQWIYSKSTENAAYISGNKSLFWQVDNQLLSLRTDLFSIWQHYYATAITLAIKEKNCTESMRKQVSNVIAQEPSNGMAWKWIYTCMSPNDKKSANGKNALLNAVRAPVNNNDQFLMNALTERFHAKWIWKLEAGTYYHPSLAMMDSLLIYQENMSQRLHYIDIDKGKLIKSDHFAEKQDDRLFSILPPYLYISTDKALHQISLRNKTTVTQPLLLTSPISDYVIHDTTALLATWKGEVYGWNPKKLMPHVQNPHKMGNNALYIEWTNSTSTLDVLDLEGNFSSYSLPSFRKNFQYGWKNSPPVDLISTGGHVIVGYTEGSLVSYHRKTGKRKWKIGFSQPILSLAQIDTTSMLISTADGAITLVDITTGKKGAVHFANLSLIGKPVPDSAGYWICTSAPALEYRDFRHGLKMTYPLPAQGGNPVLSKKLVLVSTEDGFLLSFPRFRTKQD